MLPSGSANADDRAACTVAAPSVRTAGSCLTGRVRGKLTGAQRGRLVEVLARARNHDRAEAIGWLVQLEAMTPGTMRSGAVRALVRQGYLSRQAARLLPDRRQLVRRIQLALRERGKPARRVSHGVDCVSVKARPSGIRCSRATLARLKPTDCTIKRSTGRSLAISCDTSWCKPCRRVGFRVDVTILSAARWRIRGTMPLRAPHGCGFGCDRF